MIHVIATIEIAQNKREDFLAQFHLIVPLVLEEEGCVAYGPTVDMETNIAAQPDSRDNVVVVIEKWEDLACLERHLIGEPPSFQHVSPDGPANPC